MCSRGMLVGLGQVDINLPCLVLSCLSAESRLVPGPRTWLKCGAHKDMCGHRKSRQVQQKLMQKQQRWAMELATTAGKGINADPAIKWGFDGGAP